MVDLDHRPVVVQLLDRDDGVCALGDDTTRGDPHRLARFQPPLGGTARGYPAHDRERPRGLGRPHRVAVHARAREARQVDERLGTTSEDTPVGRAGLDALRREPRDALENACPSLVDR